MKEADEKLINAQKQKQILTKSLNLLDEEVEDEGENLFDSYEVELEEQEIYD